MKKLRREGFELGRDKVTTMHKHSHDAANNVEQQFPNIKLIKLGLVMSRLFAQSKAGCT